MPDKKDNPHKNHRARLRETFRKTGLENMPDHNVLELLLFYSIPRSDTNELAHRLIDTFGSLRRVFDASYEQLMQVDGMGESSALLISSVPALCRRYMESGSTGKISLDNTEDVISFLKNKYCGIKTEVFYMLCFDGLGNLINCCKLGEGTTDEILVDKRVAVETALRNNADKIIFAHNHPNGIASPSKVDIGFTEKFRDLFSSIGLDFIDHIIIAGNDGFSMASVEKFRGLFC